VVGEKKGKRQKAKGKRPQSVRSRQGAEVRCRLNLRAAARHPQLPRVSAHGHGNGLYRRECAQMRVVWRAARHPAGCRGGAACKEAAGCRGGATCKQAHKNARCDVQRATGRMPRAIRALKTKRFNALNDARRKAVIRPSAWGAHRLSAMRCTKVHPAGLRQQHCVRRRRHVCKMTGVRQGTGSRWAVPPVAYEQCSTGERAGARGKIKVDMQSAKECCLMFIAATMNQPRSF
jgi:hypothetical protein